MKTSKSTERSALIALSEAVIEAARAAPRCEWGIDRDTGEDEPDEKRCRRIGTHQVEGPHDMDCGEYCKTHAIRVRNERCTPPHRFFINERSDRVRLRDALKIARRVVRS